MDASRDATKNEAREKQISLLSPTHPRLSKYQDKMTEHLDKINMQLDEEIAEMRRMLKENKNSVKSKLQRKSALEKEVNRLASEANASAAKQNESKELLQKAHENNTILTLKLHELQSRKTRAMAKQDYSTERLRLAQAKLATVRNQRKTGRKLGKKDTVNIQQIPQKLNAELLEKEEHREQRLQQNQEHFEKSAHNNEIHNIHEQTKQLQKELDEKQAYLSKLSTNIEQSQEHLLNVRRSIAEHADKSKELYQHEKTAQSKGGDRAVSKQSKVRRSSLSTITDAGTTTAANKLRKDLSNEQVHRFNSIESRQTGNSNGAASKSRCASINSATSLSIDAPTPASGKFKAELLNLQRQKLALEALNKSLEEETTSQEKVLSGKNALAEELSEQLRKAEEDLDNLCSNKDQTEYDANQIKPNDYDSDVKLKKLQDNAAALKDQIRVQQVDLEAKRKSVAALEKKLRPYENVDLNQLTEDHESRKVELRRLKDHYRTLQKTLREKQKELELTVVQRDSTVDRANATLNLTTTVRNHRLQEIEAIKKRISEKEELLKTYAMPAEQ